jgi:hypothetical protein
MSGIVSFYSPWLAIIRQSDPLAASQIAGKFGVAAAGTT